MQLTFCKTFNIERQTMTDTTRMIFDHYEIRKTNKQKSDFIQWIKPTVEQEGYKVEIEKGLCGARNIVIGDPAKANVIYTAHYDTCASLPFPNFITPKCFAIYLLYQVAIVVGVFVAMFCVALLLALLQVPYALDIAEGVGLIMFGLMLIGPANKHTANDNTSGVTVILDTLNAMPADLRENAAYILFDLEEAGLIGSISYRLKHYKMLKNKLILNFDCVSDGNNFLIAVKQKAKRFVPVLKEAFQSTDDYTVEIATKGVFYPSDQALFPCGVAVAALRRTKWFNILYMNRIHTNRDTVYQDKNIAFLVKGAINLLEKYRSKEG